MDPGKQKQKGQALVELALVMPVFILLVLGAIDFGEFVYGYVAIGDAVQAGAEYAARNQDFTSTDIDSVIQAESSGFLTASNISALSVSLNTSGSQVMMAVVSVTYTYTLPVRIVSIAKVPISVQAAAPVCVMKSGNSPPSCS